MLYLAGLAREFVGRQSLWVDRVCGETEFVGEQSLWVDRVVSWLKK